MKRALKITYNVLFIALIVVAGLTILSTFGIPQQSQIFVVQTGSMEPAIPAGSVIVVQPEESYDVGDVITAKIAPEANPKNPNLTITHRIIEVREEDGRRVYITQGDANVAPDLDPRPEDLVLGRERFHVPYLGYPVGFAKTQIGFIVLIVIPATLIVYSEIINIKNEILKRKEKDDKPTLDQEAKQEEAKESI